MIERKDTPMPSMQRRPPPASKPRPSAKQRPSSSNNSPPQTPPSYRIRTRGGKRASNAHASRQTPRETSLNGLTDGDHHARGAGDEQIIPNERISHDLSLIDNTRHSVVDNMLLSLNPDRPQPVSIPSDHQSFAFPLPSRFSPPRSARRRGHTHSSSSTTEYASPSDDSPLRSAGQASHGRRSISSSNIQPSLARLANSREDGSDVVKAKIHLTSRSSMADRTAGPALRRGRKSSKSSGSSSVDLGRVMGSPRWQAITPRRSSSFENSRGARRSYISTSNPPVSTTVAHHRSQPAHHDPPQAAPTLTVPAGSSSLDHSPTFPPQPSHAPPQAPIVQREGSNRSLTGYYNRKTKGGDWQLDSAGRNGDERGDPRHDDSLELTSVPAFVISRNPSPVRYTQDMAADYRQSSTSQVKDTKDRPGFFRRVFGSAKAVHHPTGDLRTPLQSSQNSIRAESRSGFTTPHRLTKPAPIDDPPSSAKDHGPPTLVKKPSSFFRRRKKSLSEQSPVSFSPLHHQPRFRPHPTGHADSPRPESNSISSLREVMNPYLSSATSNQHIRDGHNHSLPGYHSSTRPSSNLIQHPSTVRAVYSSQEPVLDEGGGNSRWKQSKGVGTTRRDSPRAGVNLKTDNVNNTQLQIDNSFLYDNSSTETNAAKSTDNAELMSRDSSSASKNPPNSPNDLVPLSEKPGLLGKSTDHQNSTGSPLQAVTKASKTTNAVPLLHNGLPISPHAFENSPGIAATNRDGHAVSHHSFSETKPVPPNSPVGPQRVWLSPEDSDDESPKAQKLSLPLEGTLTSPAGNGQSILSTRPTLTTKDPQIGNDSLTARNTNRPNDTIDVAKPSEEDRWLAKRIYDGDEGLVAKVKAAAWLGEAEPGRIYVRKAYMELFQWQNRDILAALRDLCTRLYLKGESQQVDRIIGAFSSRWCACNSNHGFKAADVVHAVTYSILLLNTDLYMADIEQKMTRSQFIKNCLPTVSRVAVDATPTSFENVRASILPSARPWAGQTEALQRVGESNERQSRRSFEAARPTYRLSTRPSDQSEYRTSQAQAPPGFEIPAEDCKLLVHSPFYGKLSAWEAQVELVLKDFYNSIRQNRLPLHGNDNKENVPEVSPQLSGLSSMTGTVLRRTPSMLSKAGSENLIYRGRQSENRVTTGRWTSKTRSRPRIYPSSTVGSSRTSSEDHSSAWTPSASSTWSKYSFSKTQTSMSIDSFASSYPQGDYQQSIGFANALSQAIIREEAGGIEAAEESLRAVPLLEEESLELAGAPWAKEGILKHKHHLDSLDKKAKDRNWVECFAVIEKGWMRLFSFNMNAKSLRQKAKSQKAAGSVVGGGNWADSAESLGKFLLRQTIASALPPPGYSKARPHVWALSLPTGAVHLFQVGTPEIVKEFVTTANYWSARLSKEPLIGAISNVEYGWSHSVINTALINSENSVFQGAPASSRPSLQNSIRSSIDQSSIKFRLPGDKVTISEWTPPQQSMVASVLLEVDQLKALLAYVKNIEEELQKHNELRSAMLIAFSPRHPNSGKAMANWERKSSYLLREIVKFRTYIDCLQAAQVQKDQIVTSRTMAAGDCKNEDGSDETRPEKPAAVDECKTSSGDAAD